MIRLMITILRHIVRSLRCQNGQDRYLPDKSTKLRTGVHSSIRNNLRRGATDIYWYKNGAALEVYCKLIISVFYIFLTSSNSTSLNNNQMTSLVREKSLNIHTCRITFH